MAEQKWKSITYQFEAKKVSKEKCYIYARKNEKSYMDATIDWLKKYGILNMWHDYCIYTGFYLYKNKTLFLLEEEIYEIFC